MTHPQNNLFQAKNKNYVVFSKHLISGRGYTVSFDDPILIYIGITIKELPNSLNTNGGSI
jgi:hypothetical protein